MFLFEGIQFYAQNVNFILSFQRKKEESEHVQEAQWARPVHPEDGGQERGETLEIIRQMRKWFAELSLFPGEEQLRSSGRGQTAHCEAHPRPQGDLPGRGGGVGGGGDQGDRVQLPLQEPGPQAPSLPEAQWPPDSRGEWGQQCWQSELTDWISLSHWVIENSAEIIPWHFYIC